MKTKSNSRRRSPARNKRPPLRRLRIRNISSIKDLKFDKNGLIPAIAQDEKTKDVLMVAYMNKRSLQKTIATGLATYWSRSRQCLWLKGDTSGHFQVVKKIYFDCDRDTLLLCIKQIGVACHTGKWSCFHTRMV